VVGRRIRGLLAAWALACVAVAAQSSAALAIAPPTTLPAKADFDARAGDRAAIPAATADARAALTRRLGPQATVSADPVTGGLRTVGRTDGLLTGPSADDAATVALDYVRAHATAFGVDGADVASLKLASRATTGAGVTHLVFGQLDDGIAAYDSALTAAVTADGRLVALGGAPVHDLDAPATTPPLGPAAARAAAQRDLGLTPDGDPGAIGADRAQTTAFANGDQARLVTLADPDGDRLAWRLTVAGRQPYVYEELVDAASGAVLTRHSLTDFFASRANVVRARPGDGTLGPVDIGQWLSGAHATTLSGPFVHAYPDRDDDDLATGEEIGPSAGDDFLFDQVAATPVALSQPCASAFSLPCTWDGDAASAIAANASVAANAGQVTAQAFYYTNLYHDWLAADPIDFTPSSYNFAVRPDTPAADDDPLHAETDDGGDVNNANMTTPADGLAPTMQMYLFTAPYAAVNGADDATVVYHEYTHGLTNRLVGQGGADGLDARQSQAMGEGWSDWYALDFLTEQGAITDTAAAGDELIGAYVTDDRRTGIRYNAVDCPVGDASTHCPGGVGTGAGGFTFGDLGRIDGATADGTHPRFEVHADGEIWSETLWDLRQAIGAYAAREVITEGLRLSPKDPSFLDMRDAILRADVAVAGGAHHAQIWQVFAHRGMGYSATTASANATHAVAATDLPPIAAAPGAPDVRALALDQDAVVHLPVRNPSGAPLTGVRATLAPATPGATVPQASADLGTIAAGADATAAFTVHVAATAGCGSVATFTLTLATDQGTESFPVSLPVGSGRAGALTRSYVAPVAIPDDRPATGATSTLAVGSHGRVGALRVTLAATHSWIGDVHAWLTSPAGTTVDLMEQPGDDPGPWYSAADLDAAKPLVFDDDATEAIQDVGAAEATIGGAWRPNEPLARFAGEDRFGTWTLRVTDTGPDETGTLSSWSLETGDPTCAVTVAPTGLVAGAGTFTAQVDPGATAGTSAAFQLGTTTAYGARSPAVALRTGGGLQTVTTTTGGLTPGTTYHVRAVALRNGAVVATGADRTFVAGSDPAPAAGDTRGATSTSAGAGTSGDGAAPSPAPASPATTAPAVTFTVPKATMSGLARTVRLDRKGRFTLAFRATPAGARSSIRLRAGARTAASRTFTVPATGRVKIVVHATAKLRATLRKKKAGVKAKATIRIGVTSFTATLTIKPYKKPAAAR
jgi:subtilisin-like proprotein convertase family protein